MANKLLTGLSWAKIESLCHTLRRNRRTEDLNRALLFRTLRDDKPWTDRRRYTSQAAFDQLSWYSFNQVLLLRLGENIREVHNTLCALDVFGEKAFKEYGRDALVRIYNRTQNPRLHTRILYTLGHGGYPFSIAALINILNELVPLKKHSDLVQTLREKNHLLKAENSKLKSQIKALKRENERLRRERDARVEYVCTKNHAHKNGHVCTKPSKNRHKK